jgi:hypothetical protein
MNRLIAALVVGIVILVAAVAYLLGERANPQPKHSVAVTSEPKTKSTSAAQMVRPMGAARLEQPVIIGKGGPNLDACGSNATVVGLNPRGDNFLAVKSAPKLDARRIDKLGPGFEIYVCDESPDGKWLGVVYEPDGQPSVNCGVTSPVETQRPYSGRCQSGWVYSKYVNIYAG